MFRRKKTLIITVVLLLAILMASCAGSQQAKPTAVPAQPTTAPEVSAPEPATGGIGILPEVNPWDNIEILLKRWREIGSYPITV